MSLIRLNNTELNDLCRERFGAASYDMTAEDMVKALNLYDVDRTKPKVSNPFDAWRDAWIRFAIDFWQTIQSQVKCPLKDVAPLATITLEKRIKGYPPFGRDIACYKCCDSQVAACLVGNPNNFDRIEKRKSV